MEQTELAQLLAAIQQAKGEQKNALTIEQKIDARIRLERAETALRAYILLHRRK